MKPVIPKCSKCRKALDHPGILKEIQYTCEISREYHPAKKIVTTPAILCPTCWESFRQRDQEARRKQIAREKSKAQTIGTNKKLTLYRCTARIPWKIWKATTKQTRLGWMQKHEERRSRKARLPGLPPSCAVIAKMRRRERLAYLLVAWARHPQVLKRYHPVGVELANELVRRIQTGREPEPRYLDQMALQNFWGSRVGDQDGLVWIPVPGLAENLKITSADLGMGSAYKKGALKVWS